jgi:hypothetical protein
MWSRCLNVLRSNEAVCADAPVGKGRVSWKVGRTLPDARSDTSDVEHWWESTETGRSEKGRCHGEVRVGV